MIGQHYFEQRHTPTIFSKAVTNAPTGSISDTTGVLLRVVPLDEQDTSYFADSARIFNLSITSSFTTCKVKEFNVKKRSEKY
jgi:hypothetical protein